MTVEIRRAHDGADLEAALAIRFEVFVDEQGVPVDLEVDADDDAATTVHLLAFVDDEPVGAVRLVAPTPGSLAHLGRLAVRAGHRRRGVGRALVQAVERAAIEEGASHLQLAAQLPVIGFYRGLGFVAHGPVFDDAGIDHRAMTKALIATPGAPSWPIVLFDLDGTLIDSGPGVTRTLARVLRAHGIEKEPAELALVVGPPLRVSLPRLGVSERALPEVIADYFTAYIDGGWQQFTVYPGIAQLLADLQDAGAMLAVATGKNEPLAATILEHAGLAGRFAAITGSLRDGTREDKADGIAEALRRLGVSADGHGDGRTGGVEQARANGIVMVGDRCYDITGARHWNIPTLFAGWGYGPASEGAAAAMTASDVAEARSILLPRSQAAPVRPVLDVGEAT